MLKVIIVLTPRICQFSFLFLCWKCQGFHTPVHRFCERAGYEVFFKDDITETECVRFQIKNAWISYQLGNQVFGSMKKSKGVPSGNQIIYQNLYENIDVRYTIYEDLLLEEVIVYEKMDLSVFEQEFTIHGVEYVLNEDGSIGFYSGETLVFSIPKPVMYELDNPQNKSYGLHYEISRCIVNSFIMSDTCIMYHGLSFG